MSFKSLLYKYYYLAIGLAFSFYLLIDPNTKIDQFNIFFCLYLLFFPLNQIVRNFKSATIKYFFLIIFLSHILGSALFFGSKDIFTYSGFSAIKNFKFNITEYLQMYSYLFLFWYSIVFLYLITNRIKFYEIKKIKITLNLIKFKSNNNLNKKIDFIFFTILFVLFFLINWMFQNSFGITGVDTGIQPLPFHLGGLIFYTVRFIIPLLLFFLLSTHSNIKLIHLFSLFIFTIMYGIASASRLGFVLYDMIILYFLFKEKKLFLFSLSIVTSIIMLFFIEISRNFIYGTNQVNESANLNILEHLINIYNFSISAKADYFSLINGMFFRLGGTQDVVLASQYDANIFGGSLTEFFRYTINPKIINVELVQRELYDWSPPEGSGFSTGDGTLSAEVLMIANHSYFKIFLLSLFFFFLFKFYDFLQHNIINNKSRLFSTVIIFLNMVLIIVKFPIYYNLICLIILYLIAKIKIDFKSFQIVK